MGRLFARLFCTTVSELYLLDYFGDDAASRLPKTIDDLRTAATAAGYLVDGYDVHRAAPSGVWVATESRDVRSTDRALVRLIRADQDHTTDRLPVTGTCSDLASLIARLALEPPGGTVVYAGLPEDAESVLPRADLTILAVAVEGRSSLGAVIRFYASWLRPGSLVVNLGSTQTTSLSILEPAIDPRIDLLSAHPLFGPAVSDPTGLIVAVAEATDGRAASPWREWFLDQLARLRLIVTPVSAEQHDDAMAFVQTLTHFALLTFAYTFVRLNRDPIDLLAVRTPVFEPLLYLAARVAHLARTSPETYRLIQTQVRRPEARTAFLETARELLAAIEASQRLDERADPATDPLTTLFLSYGSPWSPDQRDRRDRQRREHFLEMGARLVDGLNQLRQEVVAAAGQVRAIEERRTGQPPRIHVGIVDLDLLDPAKQDVASRIRLRPINLLLGSLLGGDSSESDRTRDTVIPLARARLLSDAELFDWLLVQGELVERRSCSLLVPDWFDREVLLRLLKGRTVDDSPTVGRIWDVTIEPLDEGARTGDPRPALVTLTIVLHPAEIVATRQEILRMTAPTVEELREIEHRLEDLRHELAGPLDDARRRELNRLKDQLKHQRKRLLDRRVAEVDREVRRRTRQRFHRIYQSGLEWLLSHGCTLRR